MNRVVDLQLMGVISLIGLFGAFVTGVVIAFFCDDDWREDRSEQDGLL